MRMQISFLNTAQDLSKIYHIQSLEKTFGLAEGEIITENRVPPICTSHLFTYITANENVCGCLRLTVCISIPFLDFKLSIL